MFLHINFSIFIMYYMALCESSEEKMSKCKHEHVCAQLCLTLCNFVAVARQAPLHMEFSRLAYWNGLPFPPSGSLPDLCIFFNFYFYFILLYNTVLVLPYIDMNPPWV